MRLKQQAKRTGQQDEPPDNMDKLTQETSHIFKEARNGDNCR